MYMNYMLMPSAILYCFRLSVIFQIFRSKVRKWRKVSWASLGKQCIKPNYWMHLISCIPSLIVEDNQHNSPFRILSNFYITTCTFQFKSLRRFDHLRSFLNKGCLSLLGLRYSRYTILSAPDNDAIEPVRRTTAFEFCQNESKITRSFSAWLFLAISTASLIRVKGASTLAKLSYMKILLISGKETYLSRD